MAVSRKKMSRKRKLRGFENIIGLILLIILTVAAALVAFFIVGSKLKAHNPATLEVTATGTGTEMGTDADIVIEVQNIGDSPAYVSMITVDTDAPGVSISSAELKNSGNGSITVEIGNAQPPSGGANGVVVNGHTSWSFTIHISGSGLYPGIAVKGYVYYYDASSQRLKAAPYRAVLG